MPQKKFKKIIVLLQTKVEVSFKLIIEIRVSWKFN